MNKRKWIKTAESQPDTTRRIIVKLEHTKTKEFWITEGYYSHKQKEFWSIRPGERPDLKIIGWIDVPED